MTAAQVREDGKTVAAYIVIAQRMANGARTDWRGRNGGKIDRQAEVVTERHGALHGSIVGGQASAAGSATPGSVTQPSKGL